MAWINLVKEKVMPKTAHYETPTSFEGQLEEFITVPLFPAMDRKMARMIAEELNKVEAEIWEKAQKEYAAGVNVFANFNRVAQRLQISPEKVLLVYALKHMDGLVSWANGHEVQREPIEGRILDLRIYLGLLFQMVTAYNKGMKVDNPEALTND